MLKLASAVLASAALAAVLIVPDIAEAQCCSGYSPATACSGANLTRSRWCIQNTVPTGQSALPAEFCVYGDQVVETLEGVFNIQAEGILEYQLDTQTGGAHTGTSCGNFGVGVAYDAFNGSAYGARGFWGYLLSLHEAINVWTGMSSPGWPTDWWADHQSAFPNLMDFHIMETLGTKNNDQNLLDAAAAQKERFYPDGDSADPKVVALDNVFAIMPNGDGYAGFSKMFALQSGDGVRWDGLGVPNPDVKRSEYVVAYMSLAARQQVLGILQGPGANGGGGICNNDPDSSPGDDPYLCSEDNINEIATAHCSIAANGKPSDDLDAFRSGDYANIPSGPCGGSCPSECGCDAMNNCVPIWLAADGTGGATGTGGSGASGMGGTGGRGAGVGGIGGTATGAGGSSAAGNNADADTEGGCSCRAAGTGSDGNPVGRLAALLFAAVVLARMRPEGRLSRKCDQLRRSA